MLKMKVKLLTISLKNDILFWFKKLSYPLVLTRKMIFSILLWHYLGLGQWVCLEVKSRCGVL